MENAALVHHPCPVCRGRKKRPVFARRSGEGQGFGYCTRRLLGVSSHYALVRCSSCGMVYADPRPSGQDLARIYRAMDDTDYSALAKERIRVFHAEVEALAEWTSPPGRILDVGCAEGYFLDAAAAVGWETHGVELSERAVTVAERKGHRVVRGELRDGSWPDGFFRVVTLWDVLEHVADPLATVSELSRVLADGGMLVVMTPDLSSATARVLGERWWSVVEMHLHYFTRHTLAGLLGKYGLRPLAWGTYPKRVTLGYVGRWMTSWGAVGSVLGRAIELLRLGAWTLTIDPRDQMKVYARKT